AIDRAIGDPSDPNRPRPNSRWVHDRRSVRARPADGPGTYDFDRRIRGCRRVSRSHRLYSAGGARLRRGSQESAVDWEPRAWRGIHLGPALRPIGSEVPTIGASDKVMYHQEFWV